MNDHDALIHARHDLVQAKAKCARSISEARAHLAIAVEANGSGHHATATDKVETADDVLKRLHAELTKEYRR